MAVGHVYSHGSAPVRLSTGKESAATDPSTTSQRLHAETTITQASTGVGEGAMDVDLPSASASDTQRSISRTNSDDSAYDRPQGSDILLSDGVLSDGDGVPQVQEPESSEDEDDAFR